MNRSDTENAAKRFERKASAALKANPLQGAQGRKIKSIPPERQGFKTAARPFIQKAKTKYAKSRESIPDNAEKVLYYSFCTAYFAYFGDDFSELAAEWGELETARKAYPRFWLFAISEAERYLDDITPVEACRIAILCDGPIDFGLRLSALRAGDLKDPILVFHAKAPKAQRDIYLGDLLPTAKRLNPESNLTTMREAWRKI